MPYMIMQDFGIEPYFEPAGGYDPWLDEYRNAPLGTPPPPILRSLTFYVEPLPGWETPPHVSGWSRLMFVSDDVRHVIEELEPGLHDFAPMEVRYGSPESYKPHCYYALRINQSFDAADREKSDMTIITQPNGNRVWRKKAAIPLVLTRELVLGKHLWIYYNVYCSDALHDALAAQGLTAGWKFEKQAVA